MKLSLTQLKALIREAMTPPEGQHPVTDKPDAISFPHATSRGYVIITPETLRSLCPAAVEAFDNEAADNIGSPLEPEDLEVIWVMTSKPVCEDDSEDSWTWSGTNEPELGEQVAEGWDELAVNVGGHQVVFFCKTLDDEYGLFWSNADQQWINYSY